MPAASEVDPELLAAAAERVATARDEVHEAAEAILRQIVDTGERRAQAAVDAMVEQAADVLRALTEELTATSRGLRAAGQRYAETERGIVRPGPR